MKDIKKVITVVIVLIALCLGLIAFNVYNEKQEEEYNKQTLNTSNENVVNEEELNTNNEVDNSVNNEVNNTNEINNTNTKNEVSNNLANEVSNAVNNTSTNTTSKNELKANVKLTKVSKKDFDKEYSEIDDDAEDWVDVEKQKNNLTIEINKTKENEMLFSSIKNKKVEYNKKYTIENVEANKTKEIEYCYEGQDVDYPLVFFIQNDGTVKLLDTEDGYKTGTFIAKDIDELKNVTEIEQISHTPENDSGYVASAAILKDGTIYEIQTVF